MIIISHCWLRMSCRINARPRARTRQIVYYRIRASWTFVYIIKPSSLSTHGWSSLYVSRTILKLHHRPFTSLRFSESSLYGPLASTCSRSAACSHARLRSAIHTPPYSKNVDQKPKPTVTRITSR